MTAAGTVSVSERWASRVSTLGFIGSCPGAPGTAAAVLTAAVLFGLVSFLGAVTWLPVFLLILIMGQWACRHLPEAWGDDPSQVVIDEAAGQAVAVAFLPPSLHLYGVAFVLFRLFDIWKPGPIRRVDDGGGPWAVMGDDLVAGAAARVVLLGIQVV